MNTSERISLFYEELKVRKSFFMIVNIKGCVSVITVSECAAIFMLVGKGENIFL